MPDPTQRLLTREFALIAFMQTAFSGSWSTFLLLPKYLAVKLGADSAEIGLLSASSGIIAVLAIPLMGSWIDRFGRRPLVVAGCAMVTVYAFGFAQIDAIGPGLFLLQPLHGLSFALTYNAAGTLVADRAPPARMSEAMAWFGASSVVMNAVATAAAELIAEHHGWTVAFQAAGTVGVLSILLALRLPREASHSTPRHGSDANPTVWLGPRLVRDIGAMVVCGAAFAAIFTYHQPFALQLGISEVRGFFIAFSCAVMVSRVALGGLPDRHGRRRAATVALAAYALVLVAVPWLQAGLLPVYGATFGLAHGFFYPTMNALAVEGRARAHRGRAMAAINGGFQAGYTLGVLALGYLVRAVGYERMFLTAGVLAAGATLLVRKGPAAPTTAARTAADTP